MNNLYKIGDIINPIDVSTNIIIPENPVSCFVSVPSRIDTFLCNHHFFVNPPRPQIYPVNSINFVVDERVESFVRIEKGEDLISIDCDETYRPIILHTVLIFKKILNIKNISFYIKAKNNHGIRHGGLGSSAAMQSSVAIAINKIFNNPIKDHDLVKFLAQNYGEESGVDGYLSPMASIGGAAASAIYKTNLVIIGGEAEIWSKKTIADYSVFLIRPKNIINPTGEEDMLMYQKGQDLFIEMGFKWGGVKEKILKEDIISGLEKQDYSNLMYHINMYTVGAYGDIPSYFANRWVSSGLYFDSILRRIHFLLSGIVKLTESCVFVSSGGPTISIITKDDALVYGILHDLVDFDIIKTKLTKDGPIIKITKL